MSRVTDISRDLLIRQSNLSSEHYEVGVSTLNRCKPPIDLPTEFITPNGIQMDGITAGFLRQEIIGAIVARDPAEYQDNPEAAVYLADDLIRLFHIQSRSSFRS